MIGIAGRSRRGITGICGGEVVRRTGLAFFALVLF